MSHAPIPENELLHILAAVQEGECTKRRALECVEAALAGNFRDDWLPPAEGYFGMDEMPMAVVKTLRAQASEAADGGTCVSCVTPIVCGRDGRCIQRSKPGAAGGNLHGFDMEDLQAIVAGLEAEPKTINVGNVTGVGDELLPSTFAAAAKFIRAAIAAAACAATEKPDASA